MKREEETYKRFVAIQHDEKLCQTPVFASQLFLSTRGEKRGEIRWLVGRS
jgi:hypothetical protein